MPPPKFVTKEKVYVIADRLLSQGVSMLDITNARIRTELGNKGSMEDIAPLVRSWKVSIGESKIYDVEITNEFKAELMEFGSNIWRSATKICIENESKRYNEKYADYDSMKNEIDQLYSQIDKEDNEKEEYKSIIEEYKVNTGTLYKELMKVRDNLLQHGAIVNDYCDVNTTDAQAKKNVKWIRETEQHINQIIKDHLKNDVSIKAATE